MQNNKSAPAIIARNSYYWQQTVYRFSVVFLLLEAQKPVKFDMRPMLRPSVLLGFLSLSTWEVAIAENVSITSIPTPRGVQQPFMLIKPEHPIASVVLFAGGYGVLRLNSVPPSAVGAYPMAGNLLVRSREKFASHAAYAELLRQITASKGVVLERSSIEGFLRSAAQSAQGSTPSEIEFADVESQLDLRRAGILETTILKDKTVLCIGLGTGGGSIEAFCGSERDGLAT